MIIAVPKEIKNHEYRVALRPQDVCELRKNNHMILVESQAGLGSSYSDDDYRQAGAEIIQNIEELYHRADLIVKVKEPQLSEIKYYSAHQSIFTYLHLAAYPEITKALVDCGISALAYETLTLADGSLPCLKPMSQIAGRLATQEGAKYLERPMGGKGILLSGVPGVRKGKVLILGAGIVGQNALKIAVGMGADVSIMDINEKTLQYLDDLYGSRIQTLYASEGNIIEQLKNIDLVIGAVLIPGAKAPKLIRRDMLKHLQSNSVLVDVAIDQGGCFETSRATTHEEPTYMCEDILHYCVANMPGAVPFTSTNALCEQTLPFIKELANKGIDKALADSSELRSALNIHNSKIILDTLK